MKNIVWNERCLHVGSTITNIPYTYRSLQEAVFNAPCGTREEPVLIYIEPDVYHMNGTPTSQGLIIDKPYLTLIGMGADPADTVLTDNRGHMLNAFPADESANSPAHTILCNADGFRCENLTIINTCNMDLEYPADPSKNEEKYSDTITQAYALGGNNVDDWSFSHCRLLGMLDTLSINARRISFEYCTISGTNDFLAGGERIYHRHCQILVYGPAPMYLAGSSASVFQDCQFAVNLHSYQASDLYLTKYGNPLILDHCRFYGNIKHIQWAFQPEYWQRSYYREVTLNDKPVIPGKTQPENSIPLTSASDFLLEKDIFLNMADHPLRLLVKGPGRVSYGSDATYQITACPPCPASALSAVLAVDGQKSFLPINAQLEVFVPAGITNGREDAIAELTVYCGDIQGICRTIFEAESVPQPSLKCPLSIDIMGNQAILNAVLDTHQPDLSQVTWSVVLHTSSGSDRILPFLEGPVASLKNITIPEIAYGQRLQATYYPLVPHAKKTLFETASLEVPPRLQPSIEEIHFSDFSCIRPFPIPPDEVLPGLLCMTAYRPPYLGCETEHVAQWDAGAPSGAFVYGEGRDGARYCHGLITSQRGCALRYLPVTLPSAVRAEVCIAPEKYMADGFGSANGQFLEIGIPFDPVSHTGYALRIERMPHCEKQCTFSIRHYENGTGTLVTVPVDSQNYLSECHITSIYDTAAQQLEFRIWSSGKIKPNFTASPVVFKIPASLTLHQWGLEIHHTGTVPLGNRSVIENLSITLDYQ